MACLLLLVYLATWLHNSSAASVAAHLEYDIDWRDVALQGLSEVATGVGGGASALAVAWGLAGGTGRAFGGGTKWMGLDPVVPVTSPPLLESIASFYGCPSSLSITWTLLLRPLGLTMGGTMAGFLVLTDSISRVHCWCILQILVVITDPCSCWCDLRETAAGQHGLRQPLAQSEEDGF